MVLYIFPAGYKVISPTSTPVIMFLTTLDHLPVQTICFRLLFHLLVSLWNSLQDYVKSFSSLFLAHVSH